MRSGQGVGSKSRVVLTYVTETIIMPQRIHESLQNQEGRRALSLTKQLNVGQTLADRCLIVWGKRAQWHYNESIWVELTDGVLLDGQLNI